MSKRYRASQDCIAFVEQIGVKLRNVVPRYMQIVMGGASLDGLLATNETRDWLKTYLDINARFNGRILTDDGGFKANPKGIDLTITEMEIGAISELAQWLINLHAVAESRATGRPMNQPKALTVRVEDMIIREKVYG